MTQPRLKHYGWGREGEGFSDAEFAFVTGVYRDKFAVTDFDARPVPTLADVVLRARLSIPASLDAFCTSDHYDRAAHTFGKSYPDTVRGLLNDYAAAPDVVAYPRDEADVAAVMDWAGANQASLIPFGGGSSVCGGVDASVDGSRYRASVTLDLRHLGKVAEIDRSSRAARIEGGAYGPALEAQLKPHGLTLRHFPQSYDYSTLGGWIATRSGGHFASLYTHIDDLVESMRVVTPRGTLEILLPPAPAPALRPTACSSAPKARSASSPPPGCACRTARPSAPAAPCASRTSSAPPAPSAPSARPASTRQLPRSRPQRGPQHRGGRRKPRHHGAGLRRGRPPARRLAQARASNAPPTTAASPSPKAKPTPT
jgi:hypothetical protein